MIPEKIRKHFRKKIGAVNVFMSIFWEETYTPTHAEQG